VLVVSSVHWLHILFADDIDLELRLARFEHLMERRLLLLNSVLLRQNPHNVHEWHKRVLLYEGKPREVIWGICTVRCLRIVLWPLISGVCNFLSHKVSLTYCVLYNWLVISFSLLWLGFSPRSVLVGFVVEKLWLGQVFLWAFCFPLWVTLNQCSTPITCLSLILCNRNNCNGEPYENLKNKP
jgi:hypothetical protein